MARRKKCRRTRPPGTRPQPAVDYRIFPRRSLRILRQQIKISSLSKHKQSDPPQSSQQLSQTSGLEDRCLYGRKAEKLSKEFNTTGQAQAVESRELQVGRKKMRKMMEELRWLMGGLVVEGRKEAGELKGDGDVKLVMKSEKEESGVGEEGEGVDRMKREDRAVSRSKARIRGHSRKTRRRRNKAKRAKGKTSEKVVRHAPLTLGQQLDFDGNFLTEGESGMVSGADEEGTKFEFELPLRYRE